MNKYARISMNFWLILTVLLTGWILFEVVKSGDTNQLILLVMPGLTLTMYLFRRMLMKRFEKNQQQ